MPLPSSKCTYLRGPAPVPRRWASGDWSAGGYRGAGGLRAMKHHRSATLFPHRSGLYSRGRGLAPEPGGPGRGSAVEGRGQKGGAIQVREPECGGRRRSRAAQPGRVALLRGAASAAFLASLLIASPGIALDPKSATRNDSPPSEYANLSGIWRLDWTLSDTRPRVDGSADFGRPRVQGGGRSGD